MAVCKTNTTTVAEDRVRFFRCDKKRWQQTVEGTVKLIVEWREIVDSKFTKMFTVYSYI